ncbi:hypothetical protein DSO57_1017624 [Entomophthora muscae]|uniref:Uncharacterized protein n=1 Tax=Entomophthora muscae TaxID=34485 RepID=A0ACC2RVT4_9FUNG|nr:hypothetical protein DSO57_1017624 [Entomophthora muscae]
MGTSPYDVRQVSDGARIVEVAGPSKHDVKGYVSDLCPRRRGRRNVEINHGYEIRKIHYSGNAENRIDVVFMGDGYTRSEKQKFFADTGRLVNELFQGEPFSEMAPILNFWGIFVESSVSGIGQFNDTGTPFGVHRIHGQLRGLFFYRQDLARSMCRMTGKLACDFPAILANDNYMGGMGGEFIMSTSANRSGIFGLRHEIGHSFGDFGEEYDNGYAYDGANSSPELTSIPWKHWLTGPLRKERLIYRILEYPWHDLTTPFVRSFVSTGKYFGWWLVLSVTSANESNALQIQFDNKTLPWTSNHHNDREFYEWKYSTPITRGPHTITIRSQTPNTFHIPRMLGSITLHELGSPAELNVSNHHYSAYPTWSNTRKKTYRPTHYGCLMRNMTSHSFCNVCMESMWLNLLQRLSLIETVSFHNSTIFLTTLSLGHTLPPVDSLHIEWHLESFPQPHLTNRFQVTHPPRGNWNVTVHLKSKFIRLANHPATADYFAFQI